MVSRPQPTKATRLSKCQAYWKKLRKRALKRIKAGGWSKPRPASRSGLRRKAAYKAAAALYRAVHAGEPCQWPGCRHTKWSIHHTRGRLGSLLTDHRFFTHLCLGHHDQVHSHPAKGRAMGLLAQPGEWNTAPKEAQ